MWTTPNKYGKHFNLWSDSIAAVEIGIAVELKFYLLFKKLEAEIVNSTHDLHTSENVPEFDVQLLLLHSQQLQGVP